MEKISGVYKITNNITGDFYIGSSKDIKQRWATHKCLSQWKDKSNNTLYQDFQKYGPDKFSFQILASAEPDNLKQEEQKFIEMLKPSYNVRRAKGWNIESLKESHRKSSKKYKSQFCSYNGETLTLTALSNRFYRAGISHPVQEAKKYLLDE